jgi:hypothetical protein
METQKRVIASQQGLYLKQDFLRPAGHLLYFSLANRRAILLRSLANREIGLIAWGSPAGFNKLPSEVIESASQVVNAVANEEGRIKFSEVFEVHRGVPRLGLRAWLEPDGIRWGISSADQPIIQVCDVLFGPFNFGIYSSASVHGMPRGMMAI